MRSELHALGIRTIRSSRSGERCVILVPSGFEQQLLEHFRRAPWAGWAIQDRSCYAGVEFVPPASEMPQPAPGTPLPYELHGLWFLENTGQVITDQLGATAQGEPGADIDINRAWERTQGDASILVAVMDSGIDRTHPEFAGRLYEHELAYTCPAPSDPPGNPPCPDITNAFHCCTPICTFGDGSESHGHGTLVSSIIAANANNGTPGVLDDRQFAGVDPGCTLVPVRVSYDNVVLFSSVMDAFEDLLLDPRFAAVRVINFSLNGFTCPDPEDGDYVYAMDELHQLVQAHYYAGRVIVAISGNSQTTTNTCPNIWPEVVLVGASTNEDKVWFRSGIGTALDFVAPGVGMYTALWRSACTGQPGFTVQWSSGTSDAAPIVSGICSLLFARADKLGVTLTADMVYQLLKSGAEAITSPAPEPVYQGWGRVNAYNTIMELESTYYNCPADLTHGSMIGEWGYGVPDGTVDSHDLAYFSYWHGLGNTMIADIAGVCPTQGDCESAGCATPKGVVDDDDLNAFMCIYNAGCP